jgi:hypothetical protein
MHVIQPATRGDFGAVSTEEIDRDPLLAGAGSGCFSSTAATAAKPSRAWPYIRTESTTAALFDLIALVLRKSDPATRWLKIDAFLYRDDAADTSVCCKSPHFARYRQPASSS